MYVCSYVRATHAIAAMYREALFYRGLEQGKAGAWLWGFVVILT